MPPPPNRARQALGILLCLAGLVPFLVAIAHLTELMRLNLGSGPQPILRLLPAMGAGALLFRFGRKLLQAPRIKRGQASRPTEPGP